MTTVIVNAGICGFSTRIEIARLSTRTVSAALTSDCEMVRQAAQQIRELDWQDALRKREDSLICKAAFQCIKHAGCPVPLGIIKAIEVEVGMALPRDAVIHFEVTDGR
jgi:hypothetical protein